MTIAAIEPAERNIIYVHVPASICSLVCFTVLFICSVQYLRTKANNCDYIAAAAAEVGLIFATVLNISGMIFARAEWGVWWTPSIRLISSGILLFLYAAYLILRAGLEHSPRKQIVSAVFGIIAFIDVPLVFISARFVRDIHRPGFSFESAWQSLGFVLDILGILLLAALLIWLRTDILKIKSAIKT